MTVSTAARLVFLALALTGVAAKQRALAQSCHAPSLREQGHASVRVSVQGSFASYQNRRYTGEYQGVRALAAFIHPWIYAQASLPMYRLVRNGLSERGLGDAGADVRVTALRFGEGRLTAGPELAATFPSGDETRSLGMGHTMLMPGAWLRLDLSALSLWAQVAYGRSLGSVEGAHQHGQGTGPIVNPMNSSELEHALGLAYAVHAQVRLLTRWLGAIPVADPEGQAREIAALGVQAIFGPLDVSLEVELPVVGNPFRTRTLLAVGAQW